MSTDPTTKPYLIRAIRDWALDQGYTPHLLVDAGVEGVRVPEQHVEDGKIVLNVSNNAVGEIELNNEWILFSARFGGVSHNIDVPITAVLAIFAKENGHGLFFQQTEAAVDGESGPAMIPQTKEKELESHLSAIDGKVPQDKKASRKSTGKKNHLKLVE